MEKIFFTGGAGLLALNWAAYCHDKYKIILGTNRTRISPTFASTVSISNAKSISSLESLIGKMSPDIVINTAAITNVEYCELNPEEAYNSNVKFASQIATVCKNLGIKLVHISTDHLFSGFDAYSTEDKIASPVNIYAKTKAAAEEKINSECSDSIIIRTNFFGTGTTYRSSFSDQIINKLMRNHSFWGFEDVFFTPVLASDLADCVHDLIRNQHSGIYNISSNQRISKFEFASLVAKIFGFQESLVRSCNISDRNNLVKRPNDMSLSNNKISNTLNRDLGTAEDGLRRLQVQLNHKTYQEIQAL